MKITNDAKEFIADKGYDVQFGASPLHRAIQKYLEDPLAEEILSLNVKQGDILIAGLDKENQKINLNSAKKKKRQKFNLYTFYLIARPFGGLFLFYYCLFFNGYETRIIQHLNLSALEKIKLKLQ